MAGYHNAHIRITQPGCRGVWSDYDQHLRGRDRRPLEHFYDYVDGLSGFYRDANEFFGGDDFDFKVDSAVVEPVMIGASGASANAAQSPVTTARRGRRLYRRVYGWDSVFKPTAARDEKACKWLAQEETEQQKASQQKFYDDREKLVRSYNQSVDKLERENKERGDKNREHKRNKNTWVRFRADGSPADVSDKVWIEALPLSRFSFHGNSTREHF